MKTPYRIIGYRKFTDGTRWPIYQDHRGQFVLDDDFEPKYGLWIWDDNDPEEEDYDSPLYLDHDHRHESTT